MSKNVDWSGLRVLCGEPDAARDAPALHPFDPRVLELLAALSQRLMSLRGAAPDVTTLGFFCRRGNLAKLRQAYGEMEERIGRGLAFHIAPSNVPINFAYSLAAALLAGNASIVKASSRSFEQTRVVCGALCELLDGAFADLKPYVNVVEYPREQQEITEALSAICDVRIVWGGDETIRRVREAPLAPRAFDVTFADRWSLLMAAPDAINAMDDAALSTLAQGFYNDTYWSDQNACTSPRLVYWLAGDRERAKQRFWNAVHAYAAPRYPIEPVASVDKLTALYRAALTLEGARQAPMPDQLVTRIRLERLSPEAVDFRCAGGCFLEYDGDTLEALLPLLGKKTQTVSYIGVKPEVIRAFVMQHGVRGVDRIAPVGHTMDFSLVWDGYDLIDTLSRRVFTA